MHLPGRWRGRRGRRLVVAAVVAAAIVGAGIAAAAVAGAPVPVTVRNLTIAVTDGPQDNQHVKLDATFFTPAGSARVPAILLAHGFGETKNAVRPEAEQLARAGFAVLTWSARGFGRSTGQIALDSPDYEVKDVEQLVTWLAASRGSGSTIPVTPGSASPGPPTVAPWPCWPPPTITASMPSSR